MPRYKIIYETVDDMTIITRFHSLVNAREHYDELNKHREITDRIVLIDTVNDCLLEGFKDYDK